MIFCKSELPDQVHPTPLTPLVCFSEKTFMSLREVLRVLGFVFRAPRKPKRIPEPSSAISGTRDVPLVERTYEPSGMVSVWGLRLGTEGGGEGWYRVWRWWREAQEITGTSLRRFEAMAG